jgi:arginine exporter protein ArgO
MDVFLAGVAAGYGIATPVGAIALLIMDLGIRRGFWPAFAAGAGAATAELLYSALAVIGGAALAASVESVGATLRIVSGLVLVVIGLAGLARSQKPIESTPAEPGRLDLPMTYARFVGLTVINPTTIVYFAAVVIGLGVAGNLSMGEGVRFITGAFLASLSWQTLIAALSAFAGHRLSLRARRVVSIVGNLVILAIAVVILIG